MKMNVYAVVFSIIAVIIIAAAAYTYAFSQNLATTNVSLSNLPVIGKAPNFQGISAWINSAPLNISQLKGKVVLVDFWTYSCINCIRSIPHLEAWYNAYGSNGLVIVGVHSPEFLFETNYTNILSAVRRFGITYPVAIDSNHSTWNAYGNEYWPADYLIDANGNLRYVAFGEGDYNQTEEVIRELLQSAGHGVQANLTSVPLGVNFSGVETPEIYLGYQYVDEHGGNVTKDAENKIVAYGVPNVTENDTVYLSGEWYDAPDSIIAVSGSKLFLTYHAKSVNIVASGNATTSISLTLDGKNLTADELGTDAHLSNGTAYVKVSSSRLYNLVNASTYGWHTLEIDAPENLRVYTLTFG